MKISFNGAAQTVTGSQFYVEINGKRILVDCGLYQGKRAETYERNQNFHFDPRSLDAVILTHAHIDHSGNLPNLAKQGYTGPIYGTSATSDLADLMLRDSGHIQEMDAEYVNKKRRRRGEPPIEPLYTLEDAAQVSTQFVSMEYRRTFEVVDGVTACFSDAGHILGSSSVVMTFEEKGRKLRVWFSGDIGRKNLPILRDPVFPEDVDYLIMEATYGDKPHRDPGEAHEEFYRVVKKTIEQRGKVIVPAFAVGRTQELVYSLNQLISEGRLPPIPVFVDSPLAVNASDVFLKHPECYDAETRAFIAEHRHPALDFDQLTYIRSVDESKKLNGRKDPMIIISASGMAETGRILHHLKNNIEDERNTILIVSWQAPNTLGRRLADREKKITIFGEKYIRRADVATIGGLSAHAGQNTLLSYAESTKSTVKGIFLVHTEPPAAAALSEKMKEKKIGPVYVPELYETVEL